MPNSKSAKKRLRQDENRRARNRATKSDVRSQLTKVRKAIQAGNLEGAETEFRLAAKKLDRAGSHRVIHPNAASRLKSRLSAAIKSAKQPSA